MDTAEGLDKLEALFHRALDFAPAERAGFLAELRADHPDLGAEVESLIAAHEEAASLLNLPAEAAAEWLLAVQPGLAMGRVIDHYEILGSLGKGGMGEVYLAKDLHLDRQVALKLLPAEFTRSADRLRRFTQEARAASALNHPGIVTIHEIGQADGTHFISMELVEGQTLRRQLARAALTLAAVLDVAIQVASALEAAHRAGIVHRDLKPENIMRRPDGYVKVLDFGLAKLIGPPGASVESGAPTLDAGQTTPGMILGTLHYMSPEQARGLKVDARTDIFSLGAVIYEMATRHLPFAGETNLDVLVAILEKEPPPLTDDADAARAELQRIVSKALNKDRDGRYQTMAELLTDLQALQEEAAFAARLERTGSPAAGAGNDRAAQANEKALSDLAAVTASRRPARWLTSTLSKRGAALRVIALALLLAAAIFAMLWTRAGPVNPALTPTAPAPHRMASYSITVQKYRDDKPYEAPFKLQDNINFERDYQIRLTVSSPQAGYLYLLNEGPAGVGASPAFNVLFPSETANGGSSELKANQSVQIPDQSWLRFDAARGTEKLWLVWAAERIALLEAAGRYADPKHLGEIKDPQLNDAIGVFLKAAATVLASAYRDEEKKETVIQAPGDALVHAIRLEHH
jgi:serine/threonine protein kinase